MQCSNPIRMIVGLGNPGSEYAATRHNIGFMALQKFLTVLPQGAEKHHGMNSFYYLAKWRSRPLVLQEPQTYMNLSGKAVRQLSNSTGITPEAILVIQDDLDLPLGRLRIRRGGSSGGHNGINSIIEELGRSDFWKLRLGIGRNARMNVPDYVLSPFTGDEVGLLEKVLDAAVDALKCILSRGPEAAANSYNGLNLALEPETESATDRLVSKDEPHV